MWCQMALFFIKHRSGVCFHLTKFHHRILKWSLISCYCWCCLQPIILMWIQFFYISRLWIFFKRRERMCIKIDGIFLRMSKHLKSTTCSALMWIYLLLKHQFQIARDLFLSLSFCFTQNSSIVFLLLVKKRNSLQRRPEVEWVPINSFQFYFYFFHKI
jgi:hypothetical protein